MNDQLFSVENKICIVTGGLGQIGKNFVEELWIPTCVFTRWTSPRRIP